LFSKRGYYPQHSPFQQIRWGHNGTHTPSGRSYTVQKQALSNIFIMFVSADGKPARTSF
jgi:hypothetical protein